MTNERVPHGVSGSLSRREWIRLAVGAAVGGVGGCSSGAPPAIEASVRARRWSDGIVHVAYREPVEVVAYVSMSARKVFVDRAFRDRTSWLLRAHISVSTWHWRIPLPGDDPSVPISPGDEAREFEEVDLAEWDPDARPGFDDIRIVRGRSAAYHLRSGCVALDGSGVLAVAVPDGLEVTAVEPGSEGADREDFHTLGTGAMTSVGCADDGEIVQLVGWAHRAS